MYKVQTSRWSCVQALIFGLPTMRIPGSLFLILALSTSILFQLSCTDENSAENVNNRTRNSGDEQALSSEDLQSVGLSLGGSECVIFRANVIFSAQVDGRPGFVQDPNDPRIISANAQAEGYGTGDECSNLCTRLLSGITEFAPKIKWGTPSKFEKSFPDYRNYVSCIVMSSPPEPKQIATPPIYFDCASQLGNCKNVVLDDKLDGAPLPGFKGYADPSITYDSSTKKLWMVYSWASRIVRPSNGLVGTVKTHLASSVDGGESFQFQRELNQNTEIIDPETNTASVLKMEVPTIGTDSTGALNVLWQVYTKPIDGSQSNQLGSAFQVVKNSNPMKLGDSVFSVLGTSKTSALFDVTFDLGDIRELSNCTLLTEPAYLTFENNLYLGIQCVNFREEGRRPDLDSFVLLKQNPNGSYEYVNTILTYKDSQQFRKDRIEQVDLSYSKDGGILLIGTPMDEVARGDLHYGCYVFKFEDFLAGKLQRNNDGTLVLKAIISDSDSNLLGPGACTYNRESKTGVMIIRRTFAPSTTGIEFELLKTGVML